MTDDAWFPDGDSSRVVLIGASTFDSAELPPIPAVRNNLAALRNALTYPTDGLLAREHCVVLGLDTPADSEDVGAALASASDKATDLLLVYYAGHGILDTEGKLHLALEHTNPGHVSYTAIPLELIKKDLGRAKASARVLILDCCFSGQAVEAMSTPISLVSGQLNLTGTYTLTSTTATAPAHAPPGSQHTAFTGALLRTLTHPTPLPLDEIYHHLDTELAGLGLPRPQSRTTNAAGRLALVRGPAPTVVPPTMATTEQVRFAKPRSARRRAAVLGSLVLLAMLATLLTYLLAGSNFATIPGFLFMVLNLIWVSTGPTSYELLLDGKGLTFRDGRKSAHIPWQHISYLGVLRKDPKLPTIRNNVLLVRPRPGIAPDQYRIPSWLDTNRGIHFRSWGYIPICTLDDVRGDPILLCEAVERLTTGRLFRTDQELVNQDQRLSSL